MTNLASMGELDQDKTNSQDYGFSPDELFNLDHWLDQNYLTGGDINRGQALDLAPPLYAAFSELEEHTLNEPSTRQEEPHKLPEASVPELISVVQDLRLDLDDNKRKLDLLAEYLEKLQPWIEDINSNVQSLMETLRILVDDPCNVGICVGQGS